MIRSFLFVGLGGGIGAVCRYWGQQLVLRYLPMSFPLGTFLVNVLGCLLMGVLLGFFERHPATSAAWRLSLTTGFCGGFTTFSTFAYENLALGRSGELAVLACYAVGSLLLGLLAVALGLWLSRPA